MECQLKQPRDKIISNLVFYQSLCKLIAAQNLHQQSEKLEEISKGLNYEDLRGAFPKIRYENQQVLNRVLSSAVQGSQLKDILNQKEFLRCAGMIEGGGFEQKLDILMNVIDFDGKGSLSWNDFKFLCQQSLNLCYKGSAIKQDYQRVEDPIDINMVSKIKNDFISQHTDQRNKNFDDEMSSYFADFVFEKFNQDKKGSIQLGKIKEAIKSSKEDFELFQLISGYTTF